MVFTIYYRDGVQIDGEIRPSVLLHLSLTGLHKIAFLRAMSFKFKCLLSMRNCAIMSFLSVCHLRPSFAQFYTNARNPYLSVVRKRLNSHYQEDWSGAHFISCTSPIESVDFYNIILDPVNVFFKL